MSEPAGVEASGATRTPVSAASRPKHHDTIELDLLRLLATMTSVFVNMLVKPNQIASNDGNAVFRAEPPGETRVELPAR